MLQIPILLILLGILIVTVGVLTILDGYAKRVRLKPALPLPGHSEGLSPDAAVLLRAIEDIYRHLGPSVPDCVACTDAAYEHNFALNTAKLQMAKFGSKAFYEDDGPPSNPECYEEPVGRQKVTLLRAAPRDPVLTGYLLDYAVAVAERHDIRPWPELGTGYWRLYLEGAPVAYVGDFTVKNLREVRGLEHYCPSQNVVLCCEIAYRERIGIIFDVVKKEWQARVCAVGEGVPTIYAGETPSIAAMRCHVATQALLMLGYPD